MKVIAVADDDRYKDGRDKHQTQMNRCHKKQGQDNHNDNAQQRSQLLGKKDLYSFHITCAPLDDITGMILGIPGKRQIQQMLIEGIAHMAYKELCTMGIGSPEKITDQRIDNGNKAHGKADQPEMAAQIGKSSCPID